MKYEYVNKYVQDGIGKIVFMKSVGNGNVIFIKNLVGDLNIMHTYKMIDEKPN